MTRALFVLIAVLAGFAFAARAEQAAPQIPPDAPALAGRLVAECDPLIVSAEGPGPYLDAEHKIARSRFIELQRAASNYLERLRANKPGSPPEELHDVREAYRDAARYFETIHRDPEAAEAIRCVNADYRDLIRLYGLLTPLTEANLAHIADNADLIAQYSERLWADARAELSSGRVSHNDAARIEHVDVAAHRLQDALRSAGDDPFRADGAYTELMDRLLDARDVLARFTLNTQGDYGVLWNVTQTLTDLAPQAAVAGYPYESRPLMKRH